MSEVVYEPWRPDEYPRLPHAMLSAFTGTLDAGSELYCPVENDNNLPGLRIDFEYPRAFQGIDEGYRLADIPIGTALIYRSGRSSYLARFRENAAGTMDSFPLMHWVIVSCNQCVDVVSESELYCGSAIRN